jgi:transposase-like protein
LKKVCADLKAVYTASTEEVARNALEEFGEIWDKKYPMIHQAWERHWDDLSEFFKYPPEIRRAIYTTNAIESLNYRLRKVTKNRLLFPSDDAIFKILYLAIRNASEKWTMPIREWGGQASDFSPQPGEPLSLKMNGFSSNDIFHLNKNPDRLKFWDSSIIIGVSSFISGIVLFFQ